MIPLEKQRLREEIRSHLSAMDGATLASASEDIRRILFASDPWKLAHSVFGFSPMRREPDWIGPHWPSEKTISLPRTVDATMTFFIAGSRADLVKGSLGALEPIGSETLPKADLILVPGLAFDRQGGRLGRGGGYYDRFLATTKAFKLALCFDCQLIEKIPLEPHDTKMDAIITPGAIHFCL